MGSDPEDRDERQARLEEMIKEFQEARRRGLVKVRDRTVDPRTETDTDVKAALTGPATAH